MSEINLLTLISSYEKYQEQMRSKRVLRMRDIDQGKTENQSSEIV